VVLPANEDPALPLNPGAMRRDHLDAVFSQLCVTTNSDFGRIGDAVHRGANVTRCVRFAELRVSVAHLCSAIGAFSVRCNSKHTLAKFDADAPCGRRTRRRVLASRCHRPSGESEEQCQDSSRHPRWHKRENKSLIAFCAHARGPRATSGQARAYSAARDDSGFPDRPVLSANNSSAW
jgi:hypothetical protein